MFRKGRMKLALFVALAASVSISVGGKAASESPEEYAVTVDYRDDYTHASTIPRTYYVVKGDTLASVDVPIAKGYGFQKWTLDAEGRQDVEFPLIPAQDMTLYAQWGVKVLDVVFDFAEANAEPMTIQVEYGKTVMTPSEEQIPSYPGFVFREWRLENGKTARLDIPIKSNVTYYASWIPEDTKNWTIRFDANYPDAEEIESMTVVAGEEFDVDEIPEPERQGYLFAGWADIDDATTDDVIDLEDFDVTSDVTLYAVWERQEYTITFRRNLPQADPIEDRITRFKVNAEEDVTAPEDPIREGYTFAGWHEVAKGGKPVEFPVKVTASRTYYAHWKALEVTPEEGIFEAEYTYFEPTETFPGYSGAVTGAGAIVADIANDYDSHNGYHVSYMFKKNATITFVIRSDKAEEEAKLYAKLGAEMSLGVTLTPEGDCGYRFVVNGEDVDYGSITLPDTPVDPQAAMPKSAMIEYLVGTVSLKEGENIIQLITNNENAPGGTMTATAPTVDYIRLETGKATLSWSPEIDNLIK